LFTLAMLMLLDLCTNTHVNEMDGRGGRGRSATMVWSLLSHGSDRLAGHLDDEKLASRDVHPALDLSSLAKAFSIGLMSGEYGGR
jgi:hypothetical protein